MENFVEVYVLLTDEIVPVWRPVLAMKIQEDTYEILSNQKVPVYEKWEFRPGTRVRVESAISDGQVYLRAVKEVSL